MNTRPMDSEEPTLGLDYGNVIKLIGDTELMPGVVEGIRRLRQEKFGDQVYIISRVDTRAHELKVRRVLLEKNLISANLISERNVYFCRLRSDKAPIAESLGITHFVDDRTEVLSHLRTVAHRYAMNPTPDQLSSYPADGMTIVQDWADLLLHILGR